MSVIDWNESLSVGIASIDEQHKKLVKMINDLNEAMRSGRGKDVIGNILNDLVSYTQIHFRHEEDLFARHGYPEADSHKQEHADLVAKVMDFKQQFDDGSTSLTISVMNFLSRWLTSHIKGTDREYAPFLQEKGVH